MNDTNPEPDSTTESTDDSTATDAPSRVVTYVNYAVLAGLGLLAFIAVIQFYLSMSRVISTWVTSEYRSLFHSAFNLVVLLVAALGISYQVKRMYGGGGGTSEAETE